MSAVIRTLEGPPCRRFRTPANPGARGFNTGDKAGPCAFSLAAWTCAHGPRTEGSPLSGEVRLSLGVEAQVRGRDYPADKCKLWSLEKSRKSL